MLMDKNKPCSIPSQKYFTIFGVTSHPVEFVGDTSMFRLTVPFGDGLTLFIQAPVANLWQSPDMILLRLGDLYDHSGQYLTLEELARRQLVTPERIHHANIQGDGALVCFDRHAAVVRMFRARLSVPEIYYQADEVELLCADNIGALLGLLIKPQLDETVVPMHLMYRLVCGERTYLQDVRRIVEGCQVTWKDGHLAIEQVKSLNDFLKETRYHDLNEDALSFVDKEFSDFVSALLTQVISPSNRAYGTLLSGGVDSSMIQYFLKEQDTNRQVFSSYSYDMRSPDFRAEVEYAAQAVQVLQTKHTFFPVTPQDYPKLIVDLIKLLGQPILAEPEPCFLSLAQSIRNESPEVDFLFIGYGADALTGGSLAEIWWHLEQYQHKPAVSAWLPAVELAMRKIDPNKAFVFRRVMALLPHLNDPNYAQYPGNEYELYTDFELMARCFSTETLHDVFHNWQKTETDLLGSQMIVERAQLVSYLNTERLYASVNHQSFLANGIRLIFPYHDERLVRSLFAFDPNVRFYHRGVIKPVLKAMLERKSIVNPNKKRKLGSGFYADLQGWMKDGVLSDLIHAIDRPGYISSSDFERKLAEPDWFTWNMLTLDLYKKHVLIPNQ